MILRMLFDSLFPPSSMDILIARPVPPQQFRRPLRWGRHWCLRWHLSPLTAVALLYVRIVGQIVLRKGYRNGGIEIPWGHYQVWIFRSDK